MSFDSLNAERIWVSKTASCRCRAQVGLTLKAWNQLGLMPSTLHMWLTGNSAFFALMDLNFIDFPPWRKSGGALEDIPFLPQDLVFAAQSLQFGRHIFRTRLGRVLRSIGPGYVRSSVPKSKARSQDRGRPRAACDRSCEQVELPRPQIPS